MLVCEGSLVAFTQLKNLLFTKSLGEVMVRDPPQKGAWSYSTKQGEKQLIEEML